MRSQHEGLPRMLFLYKKSGRYSSLTNAALLPFVFPFIFRDAERPVTGGVPKIMQDATGGGVLW